MTVKLDTRTADKIQQFAQRRRRLILLRGLCALVTFGIIALIAISFVDYLLFLPDCARYAMTTVAYVGTAVALYFTTIRYLSHRAGMKELARLFESASPELRDYLLSAVELADHDKDHGMDSSEFRQMLQEDVATRIGELKIESVLPTRLIVRWLQVGAGVFAVMLVLFAIPKLKFGKLMLRAAVPVANVERVSDIEIRVIEPNPAEPMRARMDQYGAVVKRLAAEHDAILVDIQAAFDAYLEHYHPAQLAWDRVHPTLTGHTIIARAWLKAVGCEG